VALAAGRGATFITRAGPPLTGSAYAPLIATLGPLVWTAPGGLVRDLPHLARLWPELGPVAVGTDADLDRTLLFEAVAPALDQIAERSPVALLFDDLHWADPDTLDLPGYLVHRLASAPLLMLATVRNDEIVGQRGSIVGSRRSVPPPSWPNCR
jgi:hypothetical protein